MAGTLAQYEWTRYRALDGRVVAGSDSGESSSEEDGLGPMQYPAFTGDVVKNA